MSDLEAVAKIGKELGRLLPDSSLTALDNALRVIEKNRAALGADLTRQESDRRWMLSQALVAKTLRTELSSALKV